MAVSLTLPPPPLSPGTGPIADAALLLDFDGTLVEIAPTPDAVRVQPGLPRLLQRLAVGLNGALAIVSGRPLRDLDRFLPVPIAKVGDHGATLRPLPDQPPESPDLPRTPAEWRAGAAALLERFPGALIEDKEHGFVVHYRLAPEAGPAAKALLDGMLAAAPGGGARHARRLRRHVLAAWMSATQLNFLCRSIECYSILYFFLTVADCLSSDSGQLSRRFPMCLQWARR